MSVAEKMQTLINTICTNFSRILISLTSQYGRQQARGKHFSIGVKPQVKNHLFDISEVSIFLNPISHFRGSVDPLTRTSRAPGRQLYMYGKYIGLKISSFSEIAGTIPSFHCLCSVVCMYRFLQVERKCRRHWHALHLSRHMRSRPRTCSCRRSLCLLTDFVFFRRNRL